MTEEVDEYPIVHIPMDKLNYKRFAPEFRERFTTHPEYMLWYPRMEVELPKLTRPINHGKWTKQAENLYQVYQSIKQTRKMWNPLNVIPGRNDDIYYVVRGCQRLCALRALKYTSDVPCRVGHYTHTWNDNTQTYNAHPYVNVNYAMY